MFVGTGTGAFVGCEVGAALGVFEEITVGERVG